MFFNVDDLLITGNNEATLAKFKSEMKGTFEMTNLGLMKYFLGLEVAQSSPGIFISQEKCVGDIYAKKLKHHLH